MTRQAERRALTHSLLAMIHGLVSGPVTLMEVCGTHTMAIGRHGLRSLLPPELRLLSGPGCPVCVTPCRQIDECIAMAREPGVTITTFGDMMRVPGTSSSLSEERSRGRDVRVVYSAADALEIARSEPTRLVVFFGIGFETTSPTVASTLVQAAERGIHNYQVLPAFKLVTPAMDALAGGGQTRIDGFICPGHVSAIIGSSAYEAIASRYGIPCVITGFDALDILQGVAMLLEQRAEARAEVQIQYTYAVPPAGNRTAIGLMDRVFRRGDASWRGIGPIPGSGMILAPEFSGHDALACVPVEVDDGPDLPDGCQCGEVLRGLIEPARCRLFGKACTPSRPVGPCMVSTEGACAAHHRFGC